MTVRVQAKKGVQPRGGWGYSAWKLYEAEKDGSGVWRWKLKDTGTVFRSDKRERHKFPDVPIDQSVGHDGLVGEPWLKIVEGGTDGEAHL